MELLITVPTYWTHPRGRALEPGEGVFDHPTPLDDASPLPRLLESLARMEGAGSVRVLILVAPVVPSLALEAEARVRELAAPFADRLSVGVLGASALPALERLLERHGCPPETVDLRRYGGVRNLQLLAAQGLEAETVLFLDDDEEVPPDYPARVRRALEGNRVLGVAGPYHTPQGHPYLPEASPRGNPFLDKARILNAAVRRLVEAGATPVRTFLAFGGNLVLRSELAGQVPFDPWIPRGEDLDYVLNAALKGHPFWFHRDLWIVHRPPRDHEISPYLKMAQDVRRFLYEREKLLLAAARGYPAPALSELDPYPGTFLRDGLEAAAREALALRATPEAVEQWGGPEEIVAAAQARARRLAPRGLDLLRRWPALTRGARTYGPWRRVLGEAWLS